MISATEIILIIIGFVIVVLGFLLPSGKVTAEVDPEEVEEIVREKLDQSLNSSVRRSMENMAKDAVAGAVDENRAALSKMSNEKVMEISEYAGTVMEDIKKNHDEVVFMYDMLNDKHKNMLSTVTEITKTAETAKQTVRDAELTAKDAKDAAASVAASIDAAAARAMVAAEEQQRMMSSQVEKPIPVPLQKPEVSQEAPPPLEDAPEQDAQEEQTEGQGIEEEAVKEMAPQFRGTVISPSFREGLQAPQADAMPELPKEDAVVTQAVVANSIANSMAAQNVGGDLSSQNKQILEKHNAGKSDMVIAREMGLGIGEVRLVIELSKKQMKGY